MKILLVEDEERIASFVKEGLEVRGYPVDWVGAGREGLARAADPDLALVILDLGLPDIDGLEVLEGFRARGASVPVLILSARGQVDDRVLGLDLGADDYLAKPFAFDELLARVRARLRPGRDLPSSVLRAGGIRLDLVKREVTDDGRNVELSPREFSLLHAFVRHPGQVLSRQQLLSRVWGIEFDPQSNLVDVYVRYLRRKLGDGRIDTVRGAGYRLVAGDLK